MLSGDTPSPGGTLTVTAVDGQAAEVGQSVAGTYGTLVLNSNGTYTYTPTVTGLTTGQSDTDTFTDTITDPAYGPQNTTPTITIDGVTQPISASQTAASPEAIADRQTAHPFAGVTITDPNGGQTETATVTLSSSTAGVTGTLSDAAGGTVTGSSYTVSGSASTVAADLDALVFTPTAHQVAPGATVSTTITAAIRDSAGERTALANTVNATAANDAPTITGTVAGQTTAETATIKPFATAVVADVDTGVQDSLTITLSNPANGTLSGTGLTAGATAGSYSLAAAAPATLTAELQALIFTPRPAAGHRDHHRHHQLHPRGQPNRRRQHRDGHQQHRQRRQH